jgi:hypothetical protein
MYNYDCCDVEPSSQKVFQSIANLIEILLYVRQTKIASVKCGNLKSAERKQTLDKRFIP